MSQFWQKTFDGIRSGIEEIEGPCLEYPCVLALGGVYALDPDDRDTTKNQVSGLIKRAEILLGAVLSCNA